MGHRQATEDQPEGPAGSDVRTITEAEWFAEGGVALMVGIADKWKDSSPNRNRNPEREMIDDRIRVVERK
jgi:hypothetical protein